MAGSPLIAGNDLTRMDPATRSLLSSPGILAIDQDTTAPARSVSADGWTRTKRMADGTTAVSVTNSSTEARTLTVDRSAVGAQGAVTDLWTGRQIADAGASIRITVAGGDTAVLRIG